MRMMSRSNQTVQDIVQSLEVYAEHVDEDVERSTEAEASMSQKDILRNLISALTTVQP